MKTNVAERPIHTHEGGRASRIGPEAQLERSVLNCLLWEDEFYEDGVSIGDRIKQLAIACDETFVADLAIRARSEMNLRHVPLWICAALALRRSTLTAKTLEQVIQRADELGEFVSLYWKANGKKVPLSAQVKKGLARAFRKFDEYQFAKYDRDGAVKLRDVMFLVHPKPIGTEQAGIWERLANGELKTPDTWETNLSAGKDKGETFTRLLSEGKLGYMALLRNLRNMIQSDVDSKLISQALRDGAARSRALPFRFIAALKYAPQFLNDLDHAMQVAAANMDKLSGTTVIAVDVSGSMGCVMSGKSEMNRQDAAAGVAILCRGICESARVIGFGSDAQEIPGFNGLALASHLKNFGDVVGHGTEVGRAVRLANNMAYDRLIVITDEQSRDNISAPLAGSKAYIINVASNRNGIGYGQFTHIHGFSENVIRYIAAMETLEGEGHE